MTNKKLTLINLYQGLLIAIICVVCLFACQGCISEDKLVGKAIKSEAATNAILALHPCNTKDSVVSKSDTVYQRDTSYQIKQSDIKDFYLKEWNFADTTRNSFKGNNMPFIQMLQKKDSIKIITITKTIKDTTLHYLPPDNRHISILTSNLADYSKTIASLEQQVKDCPKATDKWLWWFIGACVLLSISWALFGYTKMKGL
jgi:hypothetical protein